MAGDAAVSLQSWVPPKGHNCSHEIKRPLLFGRKAMTNLDSILKSRDIKDKKDGNDDSIARQQRRHRCKEQTFGLCGRRQGWGDLRD